MRAKSVTSSDVRTSKSLSVHDPAHRAPRAVGSPVRTVTTRPALDCGDHLGSDDTPGYHSRCTEQCAPAAQRRVREAPRVVLHTCSRHAKTEGFHEPEYWDEACPVVDAANVAREGPTARMPVTHISQRERAARPEQQQRTVAQSPPAMPCVERVGRSDDGEQQNRGGEDGDVHEGVRNS
jgi:hypothetical protein